MTASCIPDNQLRILDNQLDELISNIDIAITEAKDTAVAVEEICPDDAMIEEIQEGLIKNLTTMDKLQLKKEAIAVILQRLNGPAEVRLRTETES